MKTRFERIMRILLDHEDCPSPDGLDDNVRRILTVADDREFWGCREVENYTKRSKATIQNWYRRGTHNFPQPHQVLAMGPIWDVERILLWVDEHPDLMGPR